MNSSVFILPNLAILIKNDKLITAPSICLKLYFFIVLFCLLTYIYITHAQSSKWLNYNIEVT